jgi:hypothetical protein
LGGQNGRTHPAITAVLQDKRVCAERRHSSRGGREQVCVLVTARGDIAMLCCRCVSPRIHHGYYVAASGDVKLSQLAFASAVTHDPVAAAEAARWSEMAVVSPCTHLTKPLHGGQCFYEFFGLRYAVTFPSSAGDEIASAFDYNARGGEYLVAIRDSVN